MMDRRHRITSNGMDMVHRLVNKAKTPLEVQVTVFDLDFGLITESYIDSKEFDGSREGPEMGSPEKFTELIDNIIYCICCGQENEELICDECRLRENNPKDIYGC